MLQVQRTSIYKYTHRELPLTLSPATVRIYVCKTESRRLEIVCACVCVDGRWTLDGWGAGRVVEARAEREEQIRID